MFSLIGQFIVWWLYWLMWQLWIGFYKLADWMNQDLLPWLFVADICILYLIIDSLIKRMKVYKLDNNQVKILHEWVENVTSNSKITAKKGT